MSEALDAYHVWLGIPPEEQPPDCYRLLGLPQFEDRAEVIEHAADQRMAHLKSLAAGPHAPLAQKLLNEVAAARIRLLDPHKKAYYDERLRQAAGPVGRAPAPAPSPSPPAGPPADQQPVPPAGTPSPLAGVLAGQPTATWTPLGQLGEYQLLEKLGEGGMGTVYKALHTRLRRVVALKVLLRDRRWDERAVARFDREMAAVGAVDHPNVVRAMDAREVEGTRFLVTEYVEGLDLNALGRLCHPLPVPDVCEIIRQAALGLEAVHRHGLVHRDVKPSNLMVTPQGVVKLLDLGLARFQADRAADDEVTAAGMAMGTVDYMAPEQVTDAHSADIRADIYSLGCTLYKLLSGRTPFCGAKYQTVPQKMSGHVRDPVPPIQRLRGDVPAELAQVLMRMLTKDRSKRYATPAEVADAVGALAAQSDLVGLGLSSRSWPHAKGAHPRARHGSSGSWSARWPGAG
jgi:serine/threonine protein kinase